MIGELLVTALVSSGLSSLILLSTDIDTSLWNQVEESQFNLTFEQHFLSTEDFATFKTITDLKVSVIEVYIGLPGNEGAEYQHDEDIISAYSIPITVPQSGQLALFGDDEKQVFLIPPGTYQVTAEARYLQREEVPAYAEVFPDLNFFLEDEWDSAALRDDAPELWRLTFIPTDEPTEAVELYP